MKKILLVVHRYAPFPGGSEIYVRNIAEELRERGHDVTVLAQTHDPEALKDGHFNGVNVTSDHNILINGYFDLIIVHGGDVSSQNVVHNNAEFINSPVLYLIIKPSESQSCLKGLMNHRYLGVSTDEDKSLVTKYNMQHNMVTVRHGIRLAESLGQKRVKPSVQFIKPIKNIHEYPTSYWKMPKSFVSVGGFWPHKGMQELADAFTEAFGDREDVQLYLYGYDCAHLAPKKTSNIQTHFGASREKVIDAIANADLYIMNSTEEGFGLVLLEAMVNSTPWAARNIAGAKKLSQFGCVYDTQKELVSILKGWEECDPSEAVKAGREYVMANHLIRNTVDDIEAVLGGK